MTKLLYIIFTGIFFFSSSISHALEVIEILGGKANQIPIAVMPFKSFGAPKNIAKVNTVIKSDLSRSGLFYALDTRGVSASPNSDKEVNFSQWKSLEAQFLIIGRVDFLKKEKVKVSWSLIDIYKQQTILSGEYVGKKTQIRAIGHKVSDKVYERLTGSKGVFHTKIAFVEKYNNEKYKLNIADYDGYNITTLLDSKMPIISPRWSPDGKKIAFIEGRRTLKIKDIDSKKEVILLTPKDLFHMRDGDKYFTWSPDSKWLLVDWSKTLSNSEVLLMGADGSKRINLNESGYYDYSPKWVNEGKQMLWFSNRNGLKSYATSGRSQCDVYSMFFTQDAWDEFNLSDEDYKLMQAIKEEEKKKKAKRDACYHKVKASYKVFPSAYASGAIAKCRKKRAGK